MSSPEVVITGVVSAFLTVLYAVNLFNDFSTTLLFAVALARFVFSAAVLVMILVLLDRFPLWIAFLGACFELTAFVYFVGFSTNHEQIIFRFQEFPLIALYLAWIFPRWVSRLTIYPVLIVTLYCSNVLSPTIDTPAHPGELNTISLVFFTVVAMMTGAHVKERFTQQTEIDALTGAYNRRGLEIHGNALLAAAQRHKRPVSFVMVDMDGFKSINDTYGHAAGDQALRDLVAHLQSSTRKKDLVTRLGGDEFTLVFPDTDIEQAHQLMRRVHETSQQSWSYGIATALEDDTLSTAALRADRNMYKFKGERKGRRTDSDAER